MIEMPLFDWQPSYPAAPGASRDDTSQAAAEAMQPRAGLLRAKVLACLKVRALTTDECASLLEESVLSIRPRFSELRAMNAIEDTGDRRHNASGRRAAVWRVKSR